MTNGGTTVLGRIPKKPGTDEYPDPALDDLGTFTYTPPSASPITFTFKSTIPARVDSIVKESELTVELAKKLDDKANAIESTHLSNGCVSRDKLSNSAFDQVPTDGSNNLLSSGVVKTALDSIETKLEDYVKMEDLVDGLQVNEISAKGITIDGKKPSLEGHTHVVSDITDFPSQIVNSVNGDSGEVTLTGADIAVSGSDSTKIDAALADKRDYLDLTYNTKRTVVGPAWELKYRGGDVTDTATLYVVESGTSGGYDYESWSGTSANNRSVTFQLVGYNSGTHGGYFSWGTTHGNLSSVSLDTTSFEGSLVSGEKVSEYEVEDKDNLALESQLTEATEDINSKIPGAAAYDNQLADKAWVEDKVDSLAEATRETLNGKRDKLDLAVYEDTITNDYWQTESTQIPLASESGMSKTYSNGETTNCYKVIVDDYRSIGGMFRVSAYQYVMGSWGIVVSPQSS